MNTWLARFVGQRMGKKRVIAENGCGADGILPPAFGAARLALNVRLMGAKTWERKYPNVFGWKQTRRNG